MKRLLPLLLLAALLAGAERGHAEDKAVSKESALKAIEVFEGDPSSPEGRTASATLMAFAQKSDAVKIYLSRDVVPWTKDRDAADADTRDMLLVAYVAGNIHSQLTTGKAEDDPYSGWQQVFNTYEQLQMINPTVKVKEVEDLKKREKDGTLRAYAAEMLAKSRG
jgi:hypothetical protein